MTNGFGSDWRDKGNGEKDAYDLAELFRRSSDQFDKIIADSTTNEADLGANYKFSPERWRLFKNGSRQFVQYGETSNFTDADDAKLLQPDSTDTMRLETAERFRYIVQYVSKASSAFQINQDLQSGDYIGFGYGEDDIANSGDDTPGPAADGWFIYTNASIYPDVKIAEYRGGTELDAKTVSLEKGLKTWTRYAVSFNWYAVGNAVWRETFTENGDQRNKILGKTSVDDDKGPLSGNHHVFFSVKAGGSTSNLEMECGSIAMQTLGQVQANTRIKTTPHTGTISTTGAWVPLFALRETPGETDVNVQIVNTDVPEFSGSGDIQVMPISVDPENTDASDFTVPATISAANSVIEETTNITNFPDSTGTQVTSAADPGGYQLGFGSNYQEGQGNTVRSSSGSTTRKRQINNGDIVVVLGKATETGDYAVEIITEQDW